MRTLTTNTYTPEGEIMGYEDHDKPVGDGFDEVWKRFNSLIQGAEMRDVAELFYRKGACDGKESVLKDVRPLVTPEEAMRVESATRGESINYAHLGDVIEAKKHVS